MARGCRIFFSLRDELGELGLLILEKRRLGEDLPVAFQYLKGAFKREAEGLFIWVGGDSTRSNGFKLRAEGRVRC